MTGPWMRRAITVGVVSALAGCGTWNEMGRAEKGTATGATGGALVGAAVGGPVGAVAGAGVGAVVGHERPFTGDSGSRSASASASGAAAATTAKRSASYSASQSPPTTDTSPNADTSGNEIAAAPRDELRSTGATIVRQPMDSPHDAILRDPDVVREVQRSLENRGFDPGPVDGIWGPNTQAALRNFERSNGLDEDGNLDANTLSALGVNR